MDFDVKYIKRVGFMGIKRTVAEVRFQVAGANVLVKLDSKTTMWWSMNGAGLFSTGDLAAVLRKLQAVGEAVEAMNRSVLPS